MKITSDKKIALGLAIIVLALPLAVILVKLGPRIWPKAAPGVDISGEYAIVVNLTSPQVAEGQLKATLNQDSAGRVTGTVSAPDGTEPTEITGQVEGNKFTSDRVLVKTKIIPPEEEVEVPIEAEMIFEGRFDETSGRLIGQVSGEVIRPKMGVLSGTFVAQRVSGPPQPSPTPYPTATPKPQPSPTPTPTPTPQAPSERETPPFDADVSGDGAVNAVDYSLVVKAYGQGGASLDCDINQDQICNAVDLSWIIILYGTSYP